MEIPGISNNAVSLDQHIAMKQAINQQYKDILATKAFELFSSRAAIFAKDEDLSDLAKACFNAVKVFIDTIDKEVV